MGVQHRGSGGLNVRIGKIFSAAGAALIAVAGTSPAAAQFFFKSPEMASERITAMDARLGEMLPDATLAEQQAAMVWHLRAALNVAALQCGFEPTLLTLPSYNALLSNHKDELASSFNTLTNYFMRTAKTKKLGQNALDQYGTRVYSGYSTVNAQLTFCQTAGRIGRAALFAPRGGLNELAQARLIELRSSLKLAGEQQFARRVAPTPSALPSMAKQCWKGDTYQANKCGMLPLMVAARPTAMAAN